MMQLDDDIVPAPRSARQQWRRQRSRFHLSQRTFVCLGCRREALVLEQRKMTTKKNEYSESITLVASACGLVLDASGAPHFTAPIVRPCTMNRWPTNMSTSAGSVASTEAAAICACSTS